MAGYIDETGIHLPTYNDQLDELVTSYKGIFGDDLYLEPDAQEYQMLAMFGLAIKDTNDLAEAVYNSFSPTTAKGAGLSSVVKINGIARQEATYSSVDLTLTGTAGAVVTDGVAEDVAGQKWNLPASVTLDEDGATTVTATAQEAGVVTAAAGEITTISTPTRGWLTVTNAAAAVAGVAQESNAELKVRQQTSTALPSKTVLEGIVGAVANVSGVTRYRGYENDEDAADDNGQPGHSFAIVAEGGDAKEIAGAIAAKKGPGPSTVGTTSVVVRDENHIPITIRFYRPTDVTAVASITIAAKTGYASTTGDDIVTNVVDYLNGLRIGEDVLLSKLYTPINAAEPSSDKRTFDVLSITLARQGEEEASANLAMSFIECVVASADTINVVVA
ncbi:baseplate J/gp47 family protein [Pseudodesulfovibrio sp.]|uniref:baseplate J/gp47 family protein n=1 Tax=Pseudodesulfovibrio sp. TaxID=2035812 RepID=UPI00263501E6|nr:baseplate J/gp47 family protein [Pseudodesulfovibrio sp.]MDD3310943.1 hypothetical protein [Pseudodesulfovibrio sp.]